MTITEPRWYRSHQGSREAANIGATAMVAAKVYEAFGWVRWGGHNSSDDHDFYVPNAGDLSLVLRDLAARARAAAETASFTEVDRRVGQLRFLASADEDGVVTFHLSIGSTFLESES
jgi:hypothetical protein